jgi:hypothetical protein
MVRLYEKTVWRLKCLALLPFIAWLSLINRFRSTRITHDEGPALSLTSHGTRINTVHLTIESIGRGSVLPSRIVLWLGDEDTVKTPPAPLRRLLARGLEIRFSRNYGPHTKYYPFVASDSSLDIPLVTADDDVLYPRLWLRGLVCAFRDYPDFINCYLVKVISFSGAEIAGYAHWRMCDSTEPTVRNVGMGFAGVIYPPEYLRVLKLAGCAFEQSCPKADDIWLHVQALRAGYKVRQVFSRGCRFPLIPGTQEDGLWVTNHAGSNDRQVRATYTQMDYDTLQS